MNLNILMRMKKSLLLLLLILSVYLGKLSAQVSVISSGGSTLTASYTTLNAAFTAVNNGTHTGTIEVTIHTNTTEIASCSLDSSGAPGGALYTSILIKPADTATVQKVVSTLTSGIILLNLQGADNVTIDGRPMGIGTNRFLTFQHLNNTTSASFTMRLINGASNNTFRYVNFINNTFTLAGGVNVQFSTSAATSGNQNDSIYNCEINGGRSALQIAGTLANPMNNIVVMDNLITNWANQGMGVSAVLNFTIVGNTINMLTTGPLNVGPQGMFLTMNVVGSVGNVHKNFIGRFRVFGNTTALNLFGMVVSPAAAAPAIVPVLNMTNNLIAITDTATSTANRIVGIQYQGTTNPLVFNCYHNTIRIGGNQLVAPNGNPTTIGFYKTNTAATSNTSFKNNLIQVDRTGSANQHVAIWNSSPANGINSFDYNTYWSPTLFKVAWVTTFYDVTAGFRLAAAPNEQHSIIASSPFLNTGTAVLNQASAQFIPSNYIGTSGTGVTTDLYNNARSSAIPYRGAFEGNPIVNFKDAKVVEVYTFGKLPVPYAVPHEVRANISNEGIDTLFGQKVLLNISGANSFADSLYIDTLAPAATRIVSFTGFSPTVAGGNLVTVSVPFDSTNSNNVKTVGQLVTFNSYAYAEPGVAPVGGVGYNGNSGDFVAKYPLAGSNSINQVGVNFFAGGNPYQIVIYDNANDTPGVLLWTSPTYNSVAGVNTIPVSPAVPVSGTFYVGVRQIGTTNVSFAYQNENPIRDKTFFYKAVTVSSWTDFAVTNSAFRFMVEPRLTQANDLGMTEVLAPCNSVVQGSPAIAPVVRLFNYGLNAQVSIPVGISITGPVNYNQTSTYNGPLASNDAALISFPTFNPTTVGTYTLKAWASLSTDTERSNDTVTYTFVVTNLAAPTTGTGTVVSLNGINNKLAVKGTTQLDLTTNRMTFEAWVRPTSTASKAYIFSKDADTLNPGYNLMMLPGGTLSFTTSTNVGVVTLNSTRTLTNLLWSHVAAIYNGSKMVLMINGDTAGEVAQTGSLTSNANDFVVGMSSQDNYPFSGSFDEIRMWDTVRSEMDIRANMHSRLANRASPYLVGYWRFDDATGLTAADASGNCLTLTAPNVINWAPSTLALFSNTYQYQVVGSTGTLPMPNVKLNLNLVNLFGTGALGVYYFNSSPNGTSPATTPGGISSVHDRFWLIYKYGTFGFDSAQAVFQLNPGNLSVNANTANVFAYSRPYYDDGAWGLITGFIGYVDSIDVTNQRVRVNLGSSNQFNTSFAIGANNSPLPVSWKSFTAEKVEKSALLHWETASELNNSHFILERSLDAKTFEAIEKVKGAGTSARTNSYKFMDENAFAFGNQRVYYRITQVDYDGQSSTSQVVSLDLEEGMDAEINSVVPNPFAETINVTFTLPAKSTVTIEVIDVKGQAYVTKAIEANSGFNQVNLQETTGLPAGIYFLKLSNGSSVSTTKLVKLN